MIERCRFAPTPSGYLHQGNLANALLNSWLAASLHSDLILRIDADDTARVRDEYVQYIFDSLSALEIPFVLANNARSDRREYLKGELALIPEEHLFACDCSRTDLLERSCTCVLKQSLWLPGMNALRLRIPAEVEMMIDGKSIRLHEHFGDVVLWRRDDVPAYHWANVIDDRDLGITHIVRGLDLQSSTALHLHIAQLISASGVTNCDYRHHRLIVNDKGVKLSKSTNGQVVPPDLNSEYLDAIRFQAISLGQEIGIHP